MGDRKIQVLPPNALDKKRRYHRKPDAWSKLRGDEDFKDLDSQKAWELAGVALSELLGTAIVVGLGCGSTVQGIAGSEGQLSHLNVVLTFCFAISLVVTVFGHISGCHVNPAVSLSAVIFGHLSLPKCLVYVTSQCLGSCLGIGVIKLLSPGECTESSFCVTLPNSDVGVVKAMLAEAVMTCVLVWVVNAVWDRRCQDKHDSLPIKFGLAVAALAMPGAKYSGASMNPARSFGPAFMSGNWTHHWVYWVGPLCGSVVASAVYRTFFSEVTTPHSAVSTSDPDAEEEHPL